MDDDVRDTADDEARPEESGYPKAPGASKMEALRRIDRSLEHQSEQTPDRSEADARESPGDDAPVADGARDSDE